MSNISMTIDINSSLRIEAMHPHHAAPLLQLTNSNRQHLREWLPWVDYMQTETDFSRFITIAQQRHEAGTDIPCVILYNGQVAGRIGLYYIDAPNHSGALGYWLGKEFTGKGIITAACKGFINWCFETRRINRLEIKCGTGNLKSQAVAEKLGFTKEGTLRQAEKLYDRYIDLYLYAMLAKEWPPLDIRT